MEDDHIDWRAFFCAMRNIVNTEPFDEEAIARMVVDAAREYEHGDTVLALFMEAMRNGGIL